MGLETHGYTRSTAWEEEGKGEGGKGGSSLLCREEEEERGIRERRGE